MLSTPLEVSYFFLSCFFKIILNQPEVCIYYLYNAPINVKPAGGGGGHNVGI